MAELKLENNTLYILYEWSFSYLHSFSLSLSSLITLSCSYFFMYCTDVHFYTLTITLYMYMNMYNTLGSHTRENLQLFFLRFWRLEIAFKQQCSHGFWSGQKRKCLLQMQMGKWMKIYTVLLEENWNRRCGSALEHKDLTQPRKTWWEFPKCFVKTDKIKSINIGDF